MSEPAQAASSASPITPTAEDVRARRFPHAGGLGRKGYDVAEVDAFRSQVADALERLGRENEQLRDRLSAMPSEAAAEGDAAAAAGAEAAGTAVDTRPPEQAAAGILLLAQHTADEHVAAARSEAERILEEARARVLEVDAEAERAREAARAQAEQRTAEAEEHSRRTLEDLARTREALEKRLDELRDFEREYRSRMRAYLEGQLAELSAHPEDPPGLPPAGSDDEERALPAAPPTA